jgi:hypothetical protein
MNAIQHVIRIRQGNSEVEVAGTEQFVREMLAELVPLHIDSASAGSSRSEHSISSGPVPTANGYPAGISPIAPSFRDMLNAAPRASAAEKVLLAGYFTMAEGNDTFDASSAIELFNSAYEKTPNFSREFEKAAKQGYMVKARGGDGRRMSFRLTHRGIERVRQLANAEEAL